jgi:hypothetical protein
MHAQSQDPQNPDVQVLKDKLQKLEQEMQELKDEINAVEKSRQSTSGAAAPSAKSPAPAPAPTVTVTATSKPAPEPTSAQKERPQDTFELYGFAMADLGYDFNTNDPDWSDVVRPTKLPSFSGEFAPNGKVYFSVRQTRFGVKSFNSTPVGDLKTIFEFDLFGTGVDAGQTTLHLRHAYGSLGQFGAGQFWSVFVDPDVFPNTVEYWGPNGSVNFRNIQFRWTPIQKKSGHLMFALERPGASGDQGIYRDRIELQGIQPRFNLPDLTWSARLSRNWGYAQLAGAFRKIGWVDTNNDAFNLSGTAFGWGISASSNLNFSKNDVGKFQFVYGHGIENYMNDAPVDIGIENNFGNSVTPIKGVALPVTGVVAFLDHNWSDRFTSSVGYSMLNIENSDAQLPSDFHQGHYGIANLLYKPIPRVTMGSEFQFGRRVNFSDGFSADDYRLQFSFKYNWSKTFAY